MATKKKGRFHSKAQWRWAFATKQPWARRHAHNTPGGKKVRYQKLPKKKRGKRKRKS